MDIETYRKLKEKKKQESFKKMLLQADSPNYNNKTDSKLIKPVNKDNQNSWIPKNNISTYFIKPKTKNSIISDYTINKSVPVFANKSNSDNNTKEDDLVYRWLPSLANSNNYVPKPQIELLPIHPNRGIESVIEKGPWSKEDLNIGGLVDSVKDGLHRFGHTTLAAGEDYIGSLISYNDTFSMSKPLTQAGWNVVRIPLANTYKTIIDNFSKNLNNPNISDAERTCTEAAIKFYTTQYNILSNEKLPSEQLSDYLLTESDENLGVAKSGLGDGGKLAVDVIFDVEQTAGDYGLSKLMEGVISPDAIAAMRAAGLKGYEARKEGRSDFEVRQRAGAEFIKSYAIGKLTGILGNKANSEIEKWIANKAAKTPILKMFITELGDMTVSGSVNALGEFTSGIIDPVLDAIEYKDPSELSDYFDTEFYSDLWYNTKKAFFTPQFD